MRRALLALAAVAALSCRDSSVGPPPRRLDADQSRRAESHLLRQRPAPSQPSEATFAGGRIRYLGSDVRPESAPGGQPVRVTHYFESLKPLDKSWKLFVHLEAAGRAGILVNADHYPAEGLLPTDRWQAGQIIEDSYSMVLPQGGADELVGYLGFYRYDDRLPVDQPQAHDGANRVRALRIKLADEPLQLPTYKAPKRKGEIAIDGKLDDEGWQGVPSTGPFLRTDNGQAARYRTEARLTWDEQFLYAAFDVQDEDVWAKLDKRDEPIYGEEVVELFIDADGDGATYNELELSPKNVIFDAYFPARRQGMDLSWDSGMQTAVRVLGTLNDSSDKDRGWTAELKIPVANLAKVPRWPPQPGDKWRINLYRLEWHSDRKVNEGSAFSPPLVPDFHHLPRFGWLEFAP